MQLPDIHFATTSDDVTIAYWSIGEGPPLVVTHNLALNHAELEWSVPSIASMYTALAGNHRLIRFDVRRSGMSERSRGLDYTTTGLGLDITAVVDALGVERFALLGANTMGPVVIEFAARYADQVSALILCDTYPAVEGSAHKKWMEAQLALSEVGQDMSTLWSELGEPEEADQLHALFKAAAPPDLDETMPTLFAWDAAGLLSAVEAPTLVLLSRDSKFALLEESRRLAMGIPNAQLKSVEARLLPYFGGRDAVLAAIADFLGTQGPESVASTAPAGFTTIVFTDLVSSTEMVSRLGDEAGRAAVRDVEKTVNELANDYGGEVVKNLGDGSMVAFPSTSGALSFAVSLQQAMEDSPMDLRIGMAAGEPIREDGDLHGAVVAQASRIADQGAAGEIIVSESVRHLALGKGFDFEDAGEATLKGFDEPVRLWRVGGF